MSAVRIIRSQCDFSRRLAGCQTNRLLCIPIYGGHDALISRGVEVSELFHLDGGPVPGPDPERRSYQTYASFSDPDGNGWLLQEITERLPGR
jgi:hypothetical protein